MTETTVAGMPPGTSDDETIERFRRSGVSINREGDFIHEGERVAHEGLRQALFRWLDRGPDGRYVLRLDAQRFAYVDVEDTPFVARSARQIEGDGFALGLSDGTEEILDPRTLTVDAHGMLRCWVRSATCEARLSTSATSILADSLSVGADAPGELTLQVGAQRFRILPRTRSLSD